MIRKLERYAPPGYELKTELRYILYISVASFLVSFMFFLRFREAYNLLFDFENGVKVLLPNAQMPDFETLIKGAFSSFQALSLWISYYIWYHYRYFKVETKSVYLMLRLPNRFEYHMRCWAIPLAFILLSYLAIILLKVVYFTYYLNMIPLTAWPPGQSMNLWSVIL